MITGPNHPFRVDVEIPGVGRGEVLIMAPSHTEARRRCRPSAKAPVVIIHGVTCDNEKLLA